jgi:hypothetical protein
MADLYAILPYNGASIAIAIELIAAGLFEQCDCGSFNADDFEVQVVSVKYMKHEFGPLSQVCREVNQLVQDKLTEEMIMCPDCIIKSLLAD